MPRGGSGLPGADSGCQRTGVRQGRSLRKRRKPTHVRAHPVTTTTGNLLTAARTGLRASADTGSRMQEKRSALRKRMLRSLVRSWIVRTRDESARYVSVDARIVRVSNSTAGPRQGKNPGSDSLRSSALRLWAGRCHDG